MEWPDDFGRTGSDCVVVYICGSGGIKRRLQIKPTKELNWIKGLRAGYKSIGATQKDQYSWLGRTADSFVFTTEIDHKDPDRNRFDHEAGTFQKHVPPLSVTNGDHGLRVRHAQELLDAINQAYANRMKCNLLLLKGTKYGRTAVGIKSAVDPDIWIVDKVSGDVSSGFEFVLDRIERWETD